MKIVIGLGNPGKEYERTRHNVGFDVIDILCDKEGIRLSKLDLHGQIGETGFGENKLVLVKPQTFMNLSGRCVTDVLAWYKVDPQDVMIIYDDIDLPLGKLRLRKKGSAGTHNGMRSVIGLTGREDFPRLRIGTGPVPASWDLADFVLSRYQTEEDRAKQFRAFQNAADVILEWQRHNIDSAMRLADARNKEAEEKNEQADH